MSKRRSKGMKRIGAKYRDEHAKQQKHRCAYCLRKMSYKKVRDGNSFPGNYRTTEHIIPISTFGKNVFYNILAICWDCNQAKGSYALNRKQLINIVRVKKLMSIRIAYEILKMLSKEGNLYEISNKIWKVQDSQSRGGRSLREQQA